MWFIGISNRQAPPDHIIRYWNRKTQGFHDHDPITGYATRRGAMRASKHGLPYHEWGKIVQALENGYDTYLVTKYEESE